MASIGVVTNVNEVLNRRMSSSGITLLTEFKHVLKMYNKAFIKLLDDASNLQPVEITSDVHKILEADQMLKKCIEKKKVWTRRNIEISQMEEQLQKINQRIATLAQELSSAEVNLYTCLERSQKLQKELNESPKVTISDVITTARLIAPAASGASQFGINGRTPWMPDNERMQMGLAKDQGLSLNAPNVAAHSVFKDKLETNRGAAIMESYSESEYSDE